MSEAAEQPAAYADLEAVPPHLVAEIVFGRLVTQTRPSARHGAAALPDELVGPFQKDRGGPGGWSFIHEEELPLGPRVVVPDPAGWRPGRPPAGAGDGAIFEIAPGRMCEINPPTTGRQDKGAKRRICAPHGVAHLCRVDPRARTLGVFPRQKKSWQPAHTFVDQDDVCAPRFDALTCQLGLLWPFDPPPTSQPAP